MGDSNYLSTPPLILPAHFLHQHSAFKRSVNQFVSLFHLLCSLLNHSKLFLILLPNYSVIIIITHWVLSLQPNLKGTALPLNSLQYLKVHSEHPKPKNVNFWPAKVTIRAFDSVFQ